MYVDLDLDQMTDNELAHLRVAKFLLQLLAEPIECQFLTRSAFALGMLFEIWFTHIKSVSFILQP